jgi:catechol 2,3-dioxygenase-like lactoylglutathione lyase family enzyme
VSPAGDDRPSQFPFEALDFIYMPSADVARDLAFYVDVLGGETVFAIEAFDARVAQVKLSEGGPRLLLADHLDGEAPVLVHRVGDLDATIAALERRGFAPEARFGIPHGPCATLRTPGGQRLGIYELTRPEVDAHFEGRLDFNGTQA